MIKVTFLLVLLFNPILSQSQGFKGTCVGVWAKAMSYLGWGGSGERVRTLSEMEQFLQKEHGLTAELIDVPKKSDLRDVPFGKVSYGNKVYSYDKIPARVKSFPEGSVLYYGKAVSSLSDAIGQVKSMFAKGRLRDVPEAHSDIKKHIHSVKYEPSNFLQTTKSYEIAEFFAQGNKSESPKEFGVVFIIDPVKMETLDVDRFLAYAWRVSRFVQKEVLINKSIPAERIAGAVVIVNENGNWKPLRFFKNARHGDLGQLIDRG